MISEENLFSQTEYILSELIDNAQKLHSASQQEISNDVLGPLQVKQEQLISSLMEIDSIFIGNNTPLMECIDKTRWNHIQQLLSSFQSLNNSFINNLNIRKGLVANEIRNLKKSRKSLGQFQSVYTAVEEKKRNRVNTLK